jgi:hypothetical protein
MSCKLLLLAPLLAGCAADAPMEREVSGQVGQVVRLGPDFDGREPSDAEYRWVLVAAPDASQAAAMSTMSNAEFRPDLRGNYVIDRWMRYGISEDLTHRFLVGAAGMRPVPMISRSGDAVVGAQVTLDASASSSPEGRMLTFAWRLQARPRDSAATLTDTQTPSTSFTVDKTGTFDVELAAFDGELWSEPHALMRILAQ